MNKFGWSYPPGAANDPMAPYNAPDFPDDICCYCGADLPDDVTGFTPAQETAVDNGFCNVEHEALYDKHGISDNFGRPEFTPAQEEKRKELHNRIYAYNRLPRPRPATLESVLEYLPEGDFHWPGDEAGDWHVWNCGESDCPRQWHKVAYITEFERKDGKLSITLRSVDEDGNWDVYDGWEEGEEFSIVAYAFGEQRSNEFFIGWAEYWLDCAVSGRDPCEQAIYSTPPRNWVDFCLKAAENDINYLEKKR